MLFKNGFKIYKKIIIVSVFLLFSVFNFKVLIDSKDFTYNGDFSLADIEIELFNSTFGEDSHEVKGLIWCIGSDGSNYYSCMIHVTTYPCNNYLRDCY